MDYLLKIKQWKESSLVSDDLKKQMDEMTPEQLKEAFYKNLVFGTGGMREIMGPGCNRMNIITIYKATLGFARYLLANEPDAKNRGVVIAHDNRFNHDLFVKATADVLTTLGIKVYIFDSLRPTPELSFAVRYLKACGGINITASHNPKEYNGYKIYNSEGNQLILKQSNIVLAEIDKIENELEINVNPNNALVVTLSHEVDEAYYKMVMDTSLNKNMDVKNIKIVYSPSHGTGYIPVKTVMERMGYDLILVESQCEPRGDFKNTASPNPEEKGSYEKAIEIAKKKDADIICVTDPDCDRIGIAVLDEKKEVRYFSGNQTAAMLIEYILSTKKRNNALCDNSVIYNTIVTSPSGAKVAALYNVDTEQTLTGFKYIGDKIARAIENNGKVFQIGYEESYGYLINPEVRDKDGVQAVMMICEMASYYKHQNKTLIDLYEEISKKVGYHVESQYSQFEKGIDGPSIIAKLMDTFRNNNIEEIAQEKVYIKEDYLTLVKTCKGIKTNLDYEKSNVLRYVFEDGSFFAIRPSGTEPKVKFYFAIAGKTQKEAQQRHDRIKEFVLNINK